MLGSSEVHVTARGSLIAYPSESRSVGTIEVVPPIPMTAVSGESAMYDAR